MARCAASKPNGEPCERIVGASQTYCFPHDPNRAAERARNASKAARAKPTRELSDVKKRLRQLAEDVMVARVNRGCGRRRAVTRDVPARPQRGDQTVTRSGIVSRRSTRRRV
jgi:hypothetical protein